MMEGERGKENGGASLCQDNRGSSYGKLNGHPVLCVGKYRRGRRERSEW